MQTNVVELLQSKKTLLRRWFTHRVALTLLQYSLRQMVVENQPPEHRQVEQWLQRDNKTRNINPALQSRSDVKDYQIISQSGTVVVQYFKKIIKETSSYAKYSMFNTEDCPPYQWNSASCHLPLPSLHFTSIWYVSLCTLGVLRDAGCIINNVRPRWLNSINHVLYD